MKDPMIRALQEEALYTPQNVLFLLGVQYNELHPEMMQHLANFPDAEILSRKFLDFDGKWKLKPFLFDQSKSNNYIKLTKLLSQIGVETNGYVNNKLGYSIGIGSQEAREAFEALERSIPDLDLVKLANCIKNYYAENRYATKLAKFLREEAYFGYYSED